MAFALPNEPFSSVSSSSRVFWGAGESEGGPDSSPSTSLYPSTYEHVLPAHARPAAAASACRFQPSSNLVFPLRILFLVELSSLSWQLPVPLVIPPQNKSVKDAVVQWESQDEQRDVSVSTAGEKKKNRIT